MMMIPGANYSTTKTDVNEDIPHSTENILLHSEDSALPPEMDKREETLVLVYTTVKKVPIV